MENIKQRAEEIKKSILSIEGELAELIENIENDMMHSIAEKEGYFEGILDDDMEDAITRMLEDLGPIRLLNRMINFEDPKLPGHDETIAGLDSLTI